MNRSMNRSAAHKTSLLLRLLLASALGVALFGTALVASAQPKPTDWAASDVKGRSVDVASYRGKVLMLFITSAETKDLMQPITEKLVLKYGNNPKLAQVTLADFSDAPLTWKAAESASDTVTKRTAGAHDRTVRRIQAFLEKKGKPPIPGLDRKLHIVIDWESNLVSKYKHWDTEKFITVVVLNPQGDVVGQWKAGPGEGELDGQFEPIYQAVDSTLGN